MRAPPASASTVRSRTAVEPYAGGIVVVALIAAASTSPLLLAAIHDRDKVEPIGPPSGWTGGATGSARQIAESVHRGSGKPVTVPFTVSRAAIGPGLRVISVLVPIGAAGPTQYALGLAPD